MPISNTRQKSTFQSRRQIDKVLAKGDKYSLLPTELTVKDYLNLFGSALLKKLLDQPSRDETLDALTLFIKRGWMDDPDYAWERIQQASFFNELKRMISTKGSVHKHKKPRPSTKRRIQRNGHVARPLQQQQHQHATGTTNQRMEVLRFLQPERQGGGFLRTTYYDPFHLHLAIPSTHPSPIRSLTAPIFFDCTSSIAQRASKGWLPTNIGLGSCAPIDVYSTEQSSINAVYNSIPATADVTGGDECKSSNKGGHEGGTGKFQGCDHHSTQTEQLW